MGSQPEWIIEFYLDEQGGSPVRQFLAALDKKTRIQFGWAIDQLKERNVYAREPLVKHLDGKLWELRVPSDGNIYRLLYFTYSERKIIFVHGFQKKTQVTPQKEIATAQKRMESYIKRKGSS